MKACVMQKRVQIDRSLRAFEFKVKDANRLVVGLYCNNLYNSISKKVSFRIFKQFITGNHGT
jgi:hypothetical protein